MVIVNEVWDTKYRQNILLQHNYLMTKIYFKEKSKEYSDSFGNFKMHLQNQYNIVK